MLGLCHGGPCADAVLAGGVVDCEAEAPLLDGERDSGRDAVLLHLHLGVEAVHVDQRNHPVDPLRFKTHFN